MAVTGCRKQCGATTESERLTRRQGHGLSDLDVLEYTVAQRAARGGLYARR
jgi:hypothetical protein